MNPQGREEAGTQDSVISLNLLVKLHVCAEGDGSVMQSDGPQSRRQTRQERVTNTSSGLGKTWLTDNSCPGQKSVASSLANPNLEFNSGQHAVRTAGNPTPGHPSQHPARALDELPQYDACGCEAAAGNRHPGGGRDARRDKAL